MLALTIAVTYFLGVLSGAGLVVAAFVIAGATAAHREKTAEPPSHDRSA